MELYFPVVACALVVLAWPEAAVEDQLDHVGYVAGFGVGDGDSRGHDGLDNAE